MHPFVNTAINTCIKAGNIIIRSLDNIEKINVKEKSENDFVTNIDLLVEEYLVNAIQKSYPDHNILSEERGEIASNSSSDVTWVIDPIDGTNNFKHGFPQFAISIAIKEKGEVQHGIIYDPFKQEAFSATKGRGAKLNEKRIRVSKTNNFNTALVATGFAPSLDGLDKEQQFKAFHEVANSCSAIRCCGSAALDLAYVAAGRLDGYWEAGLQSWDIAAGALIVKEAGGFVSDYNAENKFLETGNIIAGNPKVFGPLQEKLNAAFK